MKNKIQNSIILICLEISYVLIYHLKYTYTHIYSEKARARINISEKLRVKPKNMDLMVGITGDFYLLSMVLYFSDSTKLDVFHINRCIRPRK